VAYSARVFRVLIASPSDVEEERDAVVSVIQAWNDLHSRSREIVLLPLRWETHTAPEFGTRPQEVINRAIVDDCDLLVGIFWTRLGSPSGKADSGTIEEIERASKANKPVMLYFSRTAINPDDIDMEQWARLKLFEASVKKNALVETYKSKNQFRDKFTQQLEIKIKEVERLSSSRVKQFALSFLNYDGGVIKEQMKYACIYYDVVDLLEMSVEDKEKLGPRINQFIRFHQTVPLATLLENIGATGVSNIFMELTYNSTAESTMLLSQRPSIDEIYESGVWGGIRYFNYDEVLFRYNLDHVPSLVSRSARKRQIVTGDDSFTKIIYGFDSSIRNLSRSELKTLDKHTWGISSELDGLQPQRTKLIQPIIYASCFHNTTIHITAKIFADSFAEPISVETEASVEVERREVRFDELIDDLS
jgi:hypothetical protein